MISFGAVLGKVTPAQIVWLLVLQVPVYAFNAQLVTEASHPLSLGTQPQQCCQLWCKSPCTSIQLTYRCPAKSVTLLMLQVATYAFNAHLVTEASLPLSLGTQPKL